MKTESMIANYKFIESILLRNLGNIYICNIM